MMFWANPALKNCQPSSTAGKIAHLWTKALTMLLLFEPTPENCRATNFLDCGNPLQHVLTTWIVPRDWTPKTNIGREFPGQVQNLEHRLVMRKKGKQVARKAHPSNVNDPQPPSEHSHPQLLLLLSPMMSARSKHQGMLLLRNGSHPGP